MFLQLKQCVETGFGTMTYSSGEKYQGQWVQNLKEGTGTYTWRDQHTVYSGEWKNDQVGTPFSPTVSLV